MEASSEGGLGPERAVAPWMDGKENTQVVCMYRHVCMHVILHLVFVCYAKYFTYSK
jgi:hypothetical protein